MTRSVALLAILGFISACSSESNKATPTSKPATTAAATTSTTLPRCTVERPTKLERIDLTVRGKARYALVHIPERWDGAAPVPVVLSFHGLGASATQQRSTDGFVASSDKDEFIVVYPQAGGTLGAFGAAWDLRGTGEVAYVEALLADLARRACVDTSRVYATGLSYGGAMTDLIACELADQIAAAAPVSAYIPKRACTPSRPVPVLSFHGVEDKLLPYAGGGNSSQLPFESWGDDWAERNGCAGKPSEKQYRATVEELSYADCKAPVVLYRVHENGHTWPGRPLGLDRDALVDFFSGKESGTPYPLMVALGLTPEEFADTISLANADIDASDMILKFFEQHQLSAE
jgi:polyhydroxybutyrate depolymerase